MKKRNNILIVDDDINTSLQYKKWLEDEGGFNLTLINDPEIAEVNFKLQNYDLVLISFRMSIVDGFDLYHKLLEISKNIEDTPSKRFRVCFMTSSLINFNALAELYSEMAKEECYVPKHVPKEIFIKHVYAVMSSSSSSSPSSSQPPCL
jgi:PleD family two-component response regulator